MRRKRRPGLLFSIGFVLFPAHHTIAVGIRVLEIETLDGRRFFDAYNAVTIAVNRFETRHLVLPGLY